MSQEHIELRGASAFELQRVDRILCELARPVIDEELSPHAWEELLQLGIRVGGDATRRDLVERAWGRKRALLRQMSALDDRGPQLPVA